MGYGDNEKVNVNLTTSESRRSIDAAVLAAAARVSEPHTPRADGGIPFVVVPKDYAVQSLEHLEALPAPRRLVEDVTVGDAASFVGYVRRFGTPATVLFADDRGSRVVAAIDYHDGPTLPSWRTHHCTLALEHSPEWVKWLALNGKRLGQEELALFLEENQIDVVAPPANELLEITRSIEATKACAFRQMTRLADGSRALAYSEEVAGRAGAAGSLTIPESIVVALRVYRGSAPYRVRARFRYRIDGGKLALYLEFAEIDRLLETVFGETLGEVVAELGATAAGSELAAGGLLLLRGKPPARSQTQAGAPK